MFREFTAGVKSYGQAWRLAWSQHLWPLLLVPGLISVVYFPVVVVLAYLFGSGIAGYLRDHWLPDFLKHAVFVVLVTVILWMLGLYLGFILFRNLVMVLYSPVLSFLSRKTEEKASSAPMPPPEPASAFNGAVRGITMSLVSLGLAIFCFCFCVVLLIIPVVGQIGMAVLLPVSQMFLAGHGFMDPTLERRGFSVAQSFRFVGRHRYRAFGCGAAFVLLAMVPVVGWFLAPTLGVVAGTLLVLDTLEGQQPLPNSLAPSPHPMGRGTG